MPRNFLALGALLAGLAVALGAFGAHGLKGRVGPDLLAIYETAARYHMYHALALMVVGLSARAGEASPLLKGAGWLFCLGLVLFSGSLYLMTLTGLRWLGAITPLGGLAFMSGWALLAWATWRRPQ